MQNNGPVIGSFQQLTVDLVIVQGLQADLPFRFLPHGRPDIRVKNIGALYRFEDIFFNGNRTAGQRRIFLGLLCHHRIRLIALRAGADHVHSHFGTGIHQGMGHVIAVAHIYQLASF